MIKRKRKDCHNKGLEKILRKTYKQRTVKIASMANKTQKIKEINKGQSLTRYRVNGKNVKRIKEQNKTKQKTMVIAW